MEKVAPEGRMHLNWRGQKRPASETPASRIDKRGEPGAYTLRKKVQFQFPKEKRETRRRREINRRHKLGGEGTSDCMKAWEFQGKKGADQSSWRVKKQMGRVPE